MTETIIVRKDTRVVIGTAQPTLIVGERINPTGKEWLRQAIRNGDWDTIGRLAQEQVQAGARIVDVNVTMPGVNEVECLPRAVQAVQRAVAVPLSLDSNNAQALEAALAVCDGKVIINSVDGSEDRLRAILPLAKRSGSTVIGLTMDRESGIPKTALQRVAIARRIRDAAAAAGIGPEDLVIDCLTLAVSADQAMGPVALEAIRMVSNDLGLNVNMGVSNVSFGLPERAVLNAAFISMACAAGLTCAIVNPLSRPVVSAILASDVLLGRDRRSRNFLRDYRARLREGPPGDPHNA
ncbi:MAG TPA: dihydropteroate synthase [Spirochaetia bacterium]|nr:dihydropteroate synthase [Spirochaetia bacterium]